MKLSTLTVAAILLSCTSLTAADDSDVTVAVKRIYENRAVDVIKTPGSSPSRNSMGIQLRFTGKPIESATRLGMFRITSMKDDQGNTIRGVYAISAPSSRMSKLRRARPVGKRPAPPRSQYDLSINMLAPSRASKSIAEMKGEITFRVSKTASASLPVSQLEGLVGKELDNAELKKLGISAKVDRYSSKGSSTSLRLKISGKHLKTFLEARFVDSVGKIVDSNSFSFGSTNEITSTTSSFRKLPIDAKLRIVVETEYRDVKVPFDLKGIALP